MYALSRRYALTLGSSVVLLPSAARAQGAWPNGPVTFIVGYALGDDFDIAARELMPVGQATNPQNVLVANPKVPANTTAELVALARKGPNKLTFSSSGVAGASHRAGALFADAAGIQATGI